MPRMLLFSCNLFLFSLLLNFLKLCFMSVCLALAKRSIYILMRPDSLEASAGDFILKLNVMSADAADLSCFLLPLIQSDPSE